MLAFLAYFALPLFWLIVASTKQTSDLFGGFGLWFADDNHFVDNVKRAVSDPTLDGGTYLVWLRNSFLYSVTSALIAALSRDRWRATGSRSSRSAGARRCSG